MSNAHRTGVTPLEKSNAERSNIGLPPLMTFEEWASLPPRAQGYVAYMQSRWPGSEIPPKCPYIAGSMLAEAWECGERIGILEAQDGEN